MAPEEEIAIPGVGGRKEKRVGRSTLAQIIQPRLEEILEIAAIEIKRSGFSRHLSAGAVLTGGGSLVKGTAELAAEILGMDARIGRPMGLTAGLVQEVSDPKYATAVGLVLYGLRPEMIGNTPFRTNHLDATDPSGGGDNVVRKIKDSMMKWFHEL